MKCLVETQSPSLATDPCLLSEEQSWASQPPFRLPKKGAEREREREGGVSWCGVRWLGGGGVLGCCPIPCNLALCHSCKLGPDICNSLSPFFPAHLYSISSPLWAPFPSSLKGSLFRQAAAAAESWLKTGYCVNQQAQRAPRPQKSHFTTARQRRCPC